MRDHTGMLMRHLHVHTMWTPQTRPDSTGDGNAPDNHHTQPPGHTMTLRVCSTPGCPTLHTGRGQCPTCRTQADKARRPHGNPYGTKGHQAFRETVLTRDPICVLCRTAQSTIADHYPIERVDLIELGLNPNDPQRGRGLCKPCHDRHTARTKPAGWHTT